MKKILISVGLLAACIAAVAVPQTALSDSKSDTSMASSERLAPAPLTADDAGAIDARFSIDPAFASNPVDAAEMDAWNHDHISNASEPRTPLLPVLFVVVFMVLAIFDIRRSYARERKLRAKPESLKPQRAGTKADPILRPPPLPA